MELGEQNAAVLEDVRGADVAEEVACGGLQPRVQLRVDVKLPGIGRFLDLQPQGTETLKTTRPSAPGTCGVTPPPSYLQHHLLRGGGAGGLIHGGEGAFSKDAVHSQTRTSCNQEDD